MSGQWIALDTHYFFSPLAERLKERYGAVGLAIWPAFLCACKRSRNPGTMSYGSDLEALRLMGLDGLELVDQKGDAFDLDAFWRLTGQLKQTKRTRRGQLSNVKATHWEHWQDDDKRYIERQKKRRQRDQNGGDNEGTGQGQAGDTVPEMSRATATASASATPPLSPPEGATPEAPQRNGNGSHVAPGAAAALKESTPQPAPPAKRRSGGHRA